MPRRAWLLAWLAPGPVTRTGQPGLLWRGVAPFGEPDRTLALAANSTLDGEADALDVIEDVVGGRSRCGKGLFSSVDPVMGPGRRERRMVLRTAEAAFVEPVTRRARNAGDAGVGNGGACAPPG